MSTKTPFALLLGAAPSRGAARDLHPRPRLDGVTIAVVSQWEGQPCHGGNITVSLGASACLWTSSYAVFTARTALNVLAMCYWLMDFKGYRRWATPFVVYGTNPIVAYVLSSLTAKVLLLARVTLADGSRIDAQRYLFERFFSPLARPANASLLYALAYVFLWLGITAVLYRKRITIKI